MRPTSAIYNPKRDDEHPRHFHMGVPSPGRQLSLGDHRNWSFTTEFVVISQTVKQMWVNISNKHLRELGALFELTVHKRTGKFGVLNLCTKHLNEILAKITRQKYTKAWSLRAV